MFGRCTTMELPPRTPRSSNGCWTCRLRRKKCDQQHPVCDICAALRITCHYGASKPDWMDGGARQEEMVNRVKREVREKAPYRRVERPRISGEMVVNIGTGGWSTLPDVSILEPPQTETITSMESSESPSQGISCMHLDKSDVVGRSESILVMFYIQSVLPFLFPFYRPPVTRGGTAWILELMIRSAVVRQATLCQGRFFFCLAQGADSRGVICKTVFSQVGEAFETLERALQAMNAPNMGENPCGAVQILASIVQMLHFEVAALTFENCGVHLDAALALFSQLLDRPGTIESTGLRSGFDTFVNSLGPLSYIPPAEHVLIPSAEQDGFSFSTALLLFDDIIASTILQKRPRLFAYHHCLLVDTDEGKPRIDLEAVIGCQNQTILQIGQIASLEEWKKECQRAGKLDVIELVVRAKPIKDALETQIRLLKGELAITRSKSPNFLDLLTTGESSLNPRPLVTLVWTHAALLYLLVVVSGWQPASAEVRCHVNQIIDLLVNQLSPPALLRTMVWPFCVVGCLAEPAHEARLGGMVEALQPSMGFATVRKALEIMKNVWCKRDDSVCRDLASCFKAQGDLVLLV